VLGAPKHLAVDCRRMLLGQNVACGAIHDARVSHTADDIKKPAQGIYVRLPARSPLFLGSLRLSR
jgi:hypothetical protein